MASGPLSFGDAKCPGWSVILESLTLGAFAETWNVRIAIGKSNRIPNTANIAEARFLPASIYWKNAASMIRFILLQSLSQPLPQVTRTNFGWQG